MNEFQRNMTLLFRSAFSEKTAPSFDQRDWRRAYNFAKAQQILPLLFYGIITAGLKPPQEIAALLEEKTFQCVAVDEEQLHELIKLEQEFEKNGIDFLPLKGALLKRMYPKSEMRSMTDIDILIRMEQRERFTGIMQTLGYTLVAESDHELIWSKQKTICVELHKRLIPSYNKDFYAYYNDGWAFAVKDEGNSHRYHMRAEDQMVYLLTHFAKHYRDSGIGVKHLLDLYVFLKENPQLDDAYVQTELEKMKLDVFYRNIQRTIAVWLEDAKPDEITDLLTDKIFSSGSFGTSQAHVFSAAFKETKSKSVGTIRARRAIAMVFPRYSDMRDRYPVLKKCPLLLPAMWVARWFTAVFLKKNAVKLQKERFKMITEENISKYQKEMNLVGLDYNFKG